MGLRGPGAGRLRLAREASAARSRRAPWKRKSLSRAERVTRFLEWLPITKGPLAGKRMRLLPEQREFVDELYGDLDAKGLRHRSIGVWSAPKGNGKSGLCAGLALCHLLGPEAEPRGEVYSASIDRGLSGIIYQECEAIITAVPEFAARVNCVRFHKRIEVLSGDGAGSTYEALSSDARSAHGRAPSLFVYDELAQEKDRTLLDNLIQGLGKRKEGLGLIISTQAPNDDHPLSQIIDDGLSGVDPSIYVKLLAAGPDADPYAESTWFDCNPALGKFLSLKDMRQAAARARRIPSFEPAFRNLKLNQRVEANTEQRIVTLQVWRQGAMPVDRASLVGRVCYGGLDLSNKHDLTALVLVFPPIAPDDPFLVLPFFWTPEGQLGGRQPAEQARFREWIKAGHLLSVPGPTIRFSFVAAALADLGSEFDLKAVAYDRWKIDDFKQDMADIDCQIPLESWGQDHKHMGPAIEIFAELALTQKLQHGGHPVLTAAVANAITVSDAAGNLKIDKPKSNKRGPVRVDGAVALAMALGLSRRFVAAPPPADLTAFLSNPVWS